MPFGTLSNDIVLTIPFIIYVTEKSIAGFSFLYEKLICVHSPDIHANAEIILESPGCT
jgi:hypothetical protein